MSKILIVNTNFSYGSVTYGGLKKMLIWVGNNMLEAGHDVTFCTLFDNTRSEKLDKRAKSIELGLSYSSNYLKRNFIILVKGFNRLRKVLKEDFDYVVSFGDITLDMLLVLRPFYKYKLITSERSSPSFNNSFMDWFKRKVSYRYVDTLVCQTDGAKNYFSKKIQKRSVVIPNPVDIPDVRWKRANTNKSIATLGRLTTWSKRQDILLEAFAIVHDKYKDYILNIYGSGPDLQLLKSKSVELGISDCVNFCGAIDKVFNVLAENEIFVLTSDFEGLPNALLEAMSVGMPCISTKCSPGGAEYLIQHGENGLLCECRNPQDIADKIVMFIGDKDLADKCANNSREFVGRFDKSIIINDWDELFSKE